MTHPYSDRLLDRPLRRDRLVQLCALALLAVALWSLPRYVDWGAAFNPDRALGLLGLLLRLGFWLWLVLLVGPAFVRRGIRRRRYAVRSGRSWWSRGRQPSGAYAWGSTLAAAGRQDPSPYVPWQPGSPPAFRAVTLAPQDVLAGAPVTVSWEADGAEQVAVAGVTGLPAQGSIVVVPTRSGPVPLTALNAHGTSTADAGPVRLRAAPRIDLTSVPSPPPAPVPTATPPPVPPPVPRLRLDVVVERQRARRLAPRPPVPGAPALPAAPVLADPDPRSSP